MYRINEEDVYRSPIILNYSEPIIHELISRTEEYVIQGIIKCGLDIDKQELIKALKYDRAQYEKGYDHGHAQGNDDQKDGMNEEEYKNSILIHEIKSIMRQLLLIADGNGSARPIKNTSRHECYKALYKIQELLGTNKYFGEPEETYFNKEEFDKLWQEEQEKST